MCCNDIRDYKSLVSPDDNGREKILPEKGGITEGRKSTKYLLKCTGF